MFLVKTVFLGILLEAGVTGSYLGENDVFHNLTLKERYQSIANKLQQHLMNDFNMDSLVRQLARNSNATSECTKHFLNMSKAQLISSKWGQLFFGYKLDAHRCYCMYSEESHIWKFLENLDGESLSAKFHKMLL